MNGWHKRMENGKWGVRDDSGAIVVPFMYDEICDPVGEVALVKQACQCGYVDMQGRQIIPCMYDNAFDNFSEGLACVCLSHRFGYIDIDNRVVIPLMYEDGRDFWNGRAFVKKDGLWGAIGTQNQVLVDFRLRYDEIIRVCGLSKEQEAKLVIGRNYRGTNASQGEEYHYINLESGYVSFGYDYAENVFSAGRAHAYINGLGGPRQIDQYGRELDESRQMVEDSISAYWCDSLAQELYEREHRKD